MREILFRGQTQKNGEKVKLDGTKVPGNWVCGGIFQWSGDYSIIYGGSESSEVMDIEKFMVYSETVGQYTGKNDKNGKKIFEGDIVRGKIGYCGSPNLHIKDVVFVVKYREAQFDELCSSDYYEFEVIGNIYDNPELLSGKADGN